MTDDFDVPPSTLTVRSFGTREIRIELETVAKDPLGDGQVWGGGPFVLEEGSTEDDLVARSRSGNDIRGD